MKTFYIAYPLLFQILSNPLSPASLSPLTSIPTAFSVVLFLWLNGWSCHIWCAILFNNNMDLHMSSLDTLVPQRPWWVFYATRCQVYWSSPFFENFKRVWSKYALSFSSYENNIHWLKTCCYTFCKNHIILTT